MRTRRILTIGVVCLALAATACGGDDAGSATTTSLIATTTTVPAPEAALSADDALMVADAYFAGYNAGDVDAVLALLEPAATYEDNFGPVSAEDWEQLLVWNASQGTQLSEANCAASPDEAGGMTVSCPHTNLDAVVQAVSGPPVPIDLTLTITPDGISRWVSLFGNPDFTTVGNPFNRWMTANHPEDAEAAGFGNWSTVEEAELHGRLRAQYAGEWSTYLADNDCGYLDRC